MPQEQQFPWLWSRILCALKRPAICILLAILLGSALSAQDAEIGSIGFESQIRLDEAELARQIELKPGQSFDRDAVLRSLEAIKLYLNQQSNPFIEVPFPQIIPDEEGKLRIIFQINEILSSSIGQLEIVGMRYFSEAKLREILLLKEDSSMELQDLPDLMNRILQLYLSRSYLFARVELESLEAGDSLKAVIRVNEGRPMRVENYLFAGNKITRDNTLLVLSGLSRLRTITPAALNQAEANILRKNYIRSCLIEPIDESTILISVEESRMTYLEGVFGFNETSSGRRDLSGLVRLKFLNLWGTDRALELYWRQLPSGTGDLELSYHESGTLRVPVAGDLSLYRSVQDSTWIKTRSSLDVYYYLLYQKYGIELAFEQITPGPRRPIVIDRNSSRSVGALWSFFQTDNATNPTRGTNVDLRYRFIWSDQSEGKKQKTALEVDAGIYYPLSNRWIGALGLHARNLDDPQAKSYELFSMGGYNSLRGFAEDAFQSWRLGWVNYEIRYRITPQTRSYIFVDQGFIAEDKDKLKSDLFGFGFGLRVSTRIGILGLEYGLGYQDKGWMDIGSGMIHMGLDTEF